MNWISADNGAPTHTKGASAPLGATMCPGGVNFSIFSRYADLVELLLFEHANAAKPTRVISLEADHHRTDAYWHVFVPGVQPGQVYGFRAHGPFAPERGWRFDGEKLLVDPYGLAVAVPDGYDRWAAARPGDNTAVAMRSVVADPSRYDWEDDKPLNRPVAETIIYELHVAGFTRHPRSKVEPAKRGTYAGLIDKIPYLKDLGVTAVELLPVFQFDRQDAPAGLVNYWGYQPVSFFAPHQAYSSESAPLEVLDEFRHMVKALHRAGLEIILDVVFNHTTEADATGPTLCYRGLANDVYYLLEKDKSQYANYTGCGNTLNAGHPVTRRMILDSLRYWVTQMHVDGFRFDLASILSRDETGQPIPNPPILWDIETDPVLAGTKLIAEAWDAAGLYQVGSFFGDRWQEWNGKFRDDVRRFVRGSNNSVSPVACRILGSPDLYGHEEREAEQSINFVTCHDGFTLNDLVSYDQKHNENNGQGNRDGTDDNLSWNCGVEGPTSDPTIEALRNRQIKNFLALTLLSAGMPMLLMGDEMRRTQLGNNNAYCHNSELTWLDWGLLEQRQDIHRFVRELNRFRQRRDVVQEGGELSLNQLLRRSHIEWHGVRLKHPDWSEQSHSLAFAMWSLRTRFVLHGILNAYWEPLQFQLPPSPSADRDDWRRCIDTALPSPEDIQPWEDAPVVKQTTYLVQPRSIVLLALALDEDAEGH